MNNDAGIGERQNAADAAFVEGSRTLGSLATNVLVKPWPFVRMEAPTASNETPNEVNEKLEEFLSTI